MADSPSTQQVLGMTIRSHFGDLRRLRDKLQDFAVARGLEPTHRVFVRVGVLKFSYCLCSTEEEGSFIVEADNAVGENGGMADMPEDR